MVFIFLRDFWDACLIITIVFSFEFDWGVFLGVQLTTPHNTDLATTLHYSDVKMGTIASQITSLTTVYTTVYAGADQRKHQSSASLAFVRGIRRGPGNSTHKWSVTRKMFPFDDVIMATSRLTRTNDGTVFPNLCFTRPQLLSYGDVLFNWVVPIWQEINAKYILKQKIECWFYEWGLGKARSN